MGSSKTLNIFHFMDIFHETIASRGNVTRFQKGYGHWIWMHKKRIKFYMQDFTEYVLSYLYIVEKDYMFGNHFFGYGCKILFYKSYICNVYAEFLLWVMINIWKGLQQGWCVWCQVLQQAPSASQCWQTLHPHFNYKNCRITSTTEFSFWFFPLFILKYR